ncbi:MAG: PAS domain S-box protein [Desulfomonilia bacterium]
MSNKPTYEELEAKIQELERRAEDVNRARDARLKSEERYHIHFSLANDVIYSLDPEFRVLSVSPNVQRILGYHPEELLGRPFQELNVLAPEYYEQAFHDVMQVLSGKKIDASVYEFITREGQRRHAEVSGVPLIRGGKPVAVISVARDITERIEMEKSRIESEQRFRAIIESARDAIFIKNAELSYIVANPYCETILGIPIQQIIGKSDHDLFDIEANRHISEVDEKVLQGEIVEEEHTRRIRGENKTFHIIKVPLRDSSGTVIGICGIARDISERKRFEEELKTKEKELENQAKYLEEVNIALKVLLDSREKEKKDVQENIVAKAKKLVYPYLEKIDHARLDHENRIYLNIIRGNLDELISPYISPVSAEYFKLTPTEIQVADLIKEGKSTKEIAEFLNVSPHAVSFHRGNIRKKLGLSGDKKNLRSFLQASGFETHS